MDRMSNKSFRGYWEAITVIEARELLNQIDIVSFPNSKKDRRKKLLRSLQKQAYPSVLRDEKPLTTEEIVGRLMG